MTETQTLSHSHVALDANVTLRRLLNQKLSELITKNPSYSIRAFAQKLELSPSHLSRVLRGEKKFSYQSILRLSRELNLNKTEIEKLLKQYKKDSKLKTESKKTISIDINQKILEFEVFKVISDWYHFPILELMKTKNFVSEPEWISKKLNVNIHLINQALERLQTLHLIEIKNNKYILTHEEMFNTSNDITSSAIKKHHQQMLDKAKQEIELQQPEIREFQALNLNFNKEDLTEAKKEIRQFFKKFNKKFSQKSGEDVYQLNLQFFSLTNNKTE